LYDRLEKIEASAKAKGRTLIQHALVSVLENPTVVSMVIGVRSIDQLESLVAACEKSGCSSKNPM